jgi:hypothetical protein
VVYSSSADCRSRPKYIFTYFQKHFPWLANLSVRLPLHCLSLSLVNSIDLLLDPPHWRKAAIEASVTLLSSATMDLFLKSKLIWPPGAGRRLSTAKRVVAHLKPLINRLYFAPAQTYARNRSLKCRYPDQASTTKSREHTNCIMCTLNNSLNSAFASVSLAMVKDETLHHRHARPRQCGSFLEPPCERWGQLRGHLHRSTRSDIQHPLLQSLQLRVPLSQKLV